MRECSRSARPLLIALLAVALPGAGCAASPPPDAPPPTIELPPASAPPAEAPAGVRELSPAEAAAAGIAPPEKEDPPRLDGERLEIAINSSSEIFVNGKRVKRNEKVVEYARTASTLRPGVQALFLVDASVPYRQVIEVMELVRRGGIDEIQLGVAPPPPPAGP